MSGEKKSRTAKKAHPTMQMGGKLAIGCELNVRGKVGGVVLESLKNAFDQPEANAMADHVLCHTKRGLRNKM